MTRAAQGVVSFLLLLVLSGAPMVAVLCAELCLPGERPAHASETSEHASDCHSPGVADDEQVSAADRTPCGDHAVASLEAAVSLGATRTDLDSAAASANPAGLMTAAPGVRSASGSVHAPSAPTRSSFPVRLALRI